MQVPRTQQNLCSELSSWGYAHFVGYNHEAAVSNLFAESFRFSKRLLLLYQPLVS